MAAFSETPSAHIAGIEFKIAGQAVTANSVVIPTASLPKFDSGDESSIRRLMLAVVDKLYAVTKAAPWAGADTVPAKVVAYKSPSITEAEAVTLTYQFVFITEAGLEVAAE